MPVQGCILPLPLIMYHKLSSFILPTGVVTEAGNKPPFYSSVTSGMVEMWVYAVVKRPMPEADYSPPFSAEIKNEWRYTSTPNMSIRGFINDLIRLCRDMDQAGMSL